MIVADKQCRSDFTALVKLQSKDGKKHVLVHKDIITRSSLRMRRKLASRHVLGANGEKARPIAIDWTDLAYISWCYIASLRDDIARDFFSHKRNEIGLSRTVLEELLVRLTKRVEDPGAYGAMDGADSQKYYMSDESIERVLEAWSRDEDLSNL
ncbi:hypothetical protein CKM354_000147600 [Cercospora kikuchii]|uniref:Uncharacterized protein n=1 Tax=Cercospora kikuchii TaxID=84275 RepID=A0A9P3C5U7_9PEZI|nr:uncharacterized protein CKM354_000147600 [Cercospora kikuchii]GIZ38049.1 hypothetical protein CKM354_000147600 [Cercospora kikuchii]